MKNFNHLRFVFLPALLAILLIAYSCKENVSEPSGSSNSIAGQILDEQDIAVPWAIVQVFNTGGIQGLIDKDTTDEDGFFMLSGLPDNSNNLNLRVDHEDFSTFEIPVSDLTKDKDKKKLGVKLLHDSACTGIIEISAVNADNEPVDDVEVRLNRDGKLIRKSFTNDFGNLVFENVCSGEYWVRLAKDGYRVIEEDFTIEEDDTIPLSFEMLGIGDDTCCNGVIYFSVKDSADNTPVKDVSIRLWKGGDLISDTLTDSDGNIKIEGLCEGEYQISFFKEGYFGQEFNFEMECDDTLEFHKKILRRECCDGVIYLFVKDSVTNNAIKNALAKLWRDGKVIAEAKSGNDGLITFTGLCEGTYGIDLMHEHYKNIEFAVELDCNDTLELHKSLVQMLKDSCCDGQLEITVIDKETKEKVSGAHIKLWKNGKLLFNERTDSGVILFEDLCEGEYWVDILHEKYLSIEFEVEIPCDELVKITKEIEKKKEDDSCCNGVLYLAPKDNETKELIVGAMVNLWFNGKKVFEGPVGEAPLKITNLCEGKYFFGIQAEGYHPISEEDFYLECNDTLELPVYMKKSEKDTCCDGQIIIMPRDKETNEIIQGAKVTLWKDGKKLKEKYVEGASVIFPDLCEGKYAIDIQHEDYKNIEFLVELGCNEVKEIEKFLEKGSEPCCDGRITVKALDDQSDEIIKGAVIRLWKDGKLIAKKVLEGEYVVFEKVCEGHYGISIEAEEYKGIEFEIEIGCDEVIGFEKFLKKKENDCCDGVIHFSVKDSNDNKPVYHVTVRLYNAEGKIKEALTKDNGTVVFENICEGEYQISFLKEGYHGQEFNFVMGCNDTVVFHKKILKRTCCQGYIFIALKDSTTNNAIKGAVAKLWKGGSKIGIGESNNDGVVKFQNVCEGHHEITLEKTNYHSREIQLEVGCNDTLEMHYKMLAKDGGDTCKTAEIQLLVKDSESKEHLAGATVWIYDKEGNVIYEGETNEDGWFYYSHLRVPPGWYKFKAWIEGYDDNHTIVEWDVCKEKEAVLMLDKIE
ncbi:SpaA isopeptide-forming pilin-related protein [Bacteroidota bacterium]